LSFFNEHQQIERYARNIAFWKNEEPNISFESDGKTMARSFMVSNCLLNMIKRTKECFDENTQKKIFQRVEELCNKERCDEIEKIKKN